MSERSERMKVASDALFDKCVEVKLMKDGMVEVHCKLGLWSVGGTDREVVRANAMHYWIQYYHDGEYDSLLSNAEAHGRRSRTVQPLVGSLDSET